MSLRQAGRDEEALAVFERVHAVAPSPRALTQVALAELALGRWLSADAHLAAALAAEDDPWIEARREVLQAELERVGARIGDLEVVGNVPGAEVWIDGLARGRLPLARPLRLLAGEVTLEVRAEGHYPITRIVPIEGRRMAREVVTLRERAPVALPPAPPVPATTATTATTATVTAEREVLPPSRAVERRRRTGVGLLAAGGAGLVVSLGLGLGRERRARRYRDDCTNRAPGGFTDAFLAGCQDQRDDALRAERAGYVTLGLSLASLGAATALLLLARPGRDDARAWRCVPAVSAGAGEVSCALRF